MEDEVTAPPLPESVQCPVCSKGFKPSKINAHLDRCLRDDDDRCPSAMEEGGPPLKKPRVTTASPPPVPANGTPTRGLRNTSSTVFSLFQNKKHNLSAQSERSPSFSEKQQQQLPGSSSSAVSRGVKRTAPGDTEPGQTDPTVPRPPSTPLTSVRTSTEAVPSRTFLTTDKPLAETLRPKTLEEYFGQNKVVGEHTLLRSLLDSQDIPSLILWGPPGCGKVINLNDPNMWLHCILHILFLHALMQLPLTQSWHNVKAAKYIAPICPLM